MLENVSSDKLQIIANTTNIASSQEVNNVAVYKLSQQTFVK